jgi:hypothetical protein
LKGRLDQPVWTELIEVFGQLFRPVAGDETILRATKPFPAFGADIWKQPMVISLPTKTADSAGCPTGDSQMRTLSFILAFAFMLAGPSMVGSSENTLPGIGTFAYNGSPIASAPRAVVVAAR